MTLALNVQNRNYLLDPQVMYTLGRGEGVDILVKHAMVSRRHCRFFFQDGHWILEDLGSAHGTFLSGAKVKETKISEDVVGKLGGKQGIDFQIKYLNVGHSEREEANQAVLKLTDRPRIQLAQRVRIGTDSRNDWIVNDLTASPFHAEISRNSQGRYELIDLNSLNGVFINGRKSNRVLLQEEDIIRIGQQQKRFTSDGLEETNGVKGARVKLNGISYVADSNVTLLRNVNLNLGPATLTAIVGPSGAGKSTLMDIITGKKRVSGGSREIRLENEEGECTNIGFVPQADILHTKLTVRQALKYGADLRFPSSTPRMKKSQRIDEVLKLVELDSRADLRIDKLSGGQRKRCSIALELLSQPDVLVLDEPTSGLDPGLDLHFMELMRKLTLVGQTVIVVTHAVDNVDLCDNVVLLRTGGTIAYFGPPQTILKSTNEPSWAHLFRSVSTPIPVASSNVNVEKAGVSETLFPPKQQNYLSQILTLSKRYFAVITADRFYLALLVILPMMLGFIGFASGNDFGLSQNETSKGQLIPNPQARMLALILVLGSVFLALAASIQEVVKEADIRARELRIGVRNSSYISSKILVLGTIVFLQVSGFYAFTFWGRKAGNEPQLFASSKYEIYLICLTLAVCSMALGLLISTLISSQEQGMPTLVLTTMAQIVISGALPIRIDWLTELIGIINPAYWAMNALGASANLNFVTGLQGEEAFGRWNNSEINVQNPLIILGIMTLIFSISAALSLHRKK